MRLIPDLAIRSAMSFKLAGVDEYLLSFGFIDSLADFIAQQAELADANIAINGVALSGSLFENRQLLMRTYNALSSNYKIYRNERLSHGRCQCRYGCSKPWERIKRLLQHWRCDFISRKLHPLYVHHMNRTRQTRIKRVNHP